MKRLFRLTILTALVAVPIDLSGSRLAISSAECQTASCTSWTGRICSTPEADWIDFKCASGCEVGGS